VIIYNLGFVNQHKNNRISFTAKPIPFNVLKQMEKRLLEANEIDIFCHASPDEDTFNGAKIMADWLISKGKKVKIFAEGKLKGLLFNDSDKKLCIVDPREINYYKTADLALVLDCHSTQRLPQKSIKLLDTYQESNILGIDHHKPDGDDVRIGNTNNPFYIDTTAKSCNGIIYRFFEGLGIKLNEKTLGNIYCGMLNDLNKSRCLKYVNEDGVYRVKRTNEIQKFPESEELLNKVENQLSSAKKAEILEHLDILSNLTPEETAFQKKLFTEMVQFTKNGKLAYIVIEPENKEWKKLGQDNTITSAILSDLRKRLLENCREDKLIPDTLRRKLNDIKGIIIFYRGEENIVSSEEIYRMSIHSKDNYADDLIDYIQDNLYPKIKAGGHPNRAGGRINTVNTDRCNSFINYFLTAAEKLN